MRHAVHHTLAIALGFNAVTPGILKKALECRQALWHRGTAHTGGRQPGARCCGNAGAHAAIMGVANQARGVSTVGQAVRPAIAIVDGPTHQVPSPEQGVVCASQIVSRLLS